jgi:(p)ppGpp synthase/HD superfamily hydrolase
MLHVCYIIFIICNFTNLASKIFEKNTNKIINIIDKKLILDNNINNNLNIYYEKRIKSKKRIISKIQNLKIPYDVFGVRIIYDCKSNYYNTNIAYSIKNIIQENFNTLDCLYDDYIEKPKKNNYQSLHIYIVSFLLIEIQIRNSNMHNISINGSASHYYKNK